MCGQQRNLDLKVYSRRSQIILPIHIRQHQVDPALQETWRKVIVAHVSVIWLIDLVYITRFHIEVHITTAILLIKNKRTSWLTGRMKSIKYV